MKLIHFIQFLTLVASCYGASQTWTCNFAENVASKCLAPSSMASSASCLPVMTYSFAPCSNGVLLGILPLPVSGILGGIGLHEATINVNGVEALILHPALISAPYSSVSNSNPSINVPWSFSASGPQTPYVYGRFDEAIEFQVTAKVNDAC